MMSLALNNWALVNCMEDSLSRKSVIQTIQSLSCICFQVSLYNTETVTGVTAVT